MSHMRASDVDENHLDEDVHKLVHRRFLFLWIDFLTPSHSSSHRKHVLDRPPFVVQSSLERSLHLRTELGTSDELLQTDEGADNHVPNVVGDPATESLDQVSQSSLPHTHNVVDILGRDPLGPEKVLNAPLVNLDVGNKFIQEHIRPVVNHGLEGRFILGGPDVPAGDSMGEVHAKKGLSKGYPRCRSTCMNRLANVIVLSGGIVLGLLWSFLDGGIFFIIAAAITGFVSWLAGAHDPRSSAVTVGLVVGALGGVVAILRRVLAGVDAYHQEKARVRRLNLDE